MATNVSQQDETLHKVIEWCDQREVEGLRHCQCFAAEA